MTAEEMDRRRARIALAMDVMARALVDEDSFGPWLACGVPDGTYDDEVEKALDEAAKPYLETYRGMTRDEWEDLCSCWAFVMARGCFGDVPAIGMLTYESGSLL